MTDSPLPDEKIMCHMTGFEKSCYDMVTKCKCRKWVHWQGEHPQIKGKVVDQWDCRDHLDHLMGIQVVQAIRQTTNTINEWRKEVDQTNAGAIAGVLGHLNKQVNEALALGVAESVAQIALDPSRSQNGTTEP